MHLHAKYKQIERLRPFPMEPPPEILNPANFCLATLMVSEPSEWNRVPASVRQCTSVAQFKTKLKTHLFTLHYY